MKKGDTRAIYSLRFQALLAHVSIGFEADSMPKKSIFAMFFASSCQIRGVLAVYAGHLCELFDSGAIFLHVAVRRHGEGVGHRLSLLQLG